MIVNDYFRPEQPTASECLRRAEPLARQRGIALPSLQVIRRRLNKLPAGARLVRRGGADDMGPFVEPSVDDLEPMDLVGADALTLDVMCDWRGDGRARRVRLHAWQDHKSRAIVGYCLMETECAEGYRRSFGAMCEQHGAPLEVQIDNGRALCSIGLTGGAANIYRRRVSAEQGIITRIVGADRVVFVPPATGRLKPIERAFKTLNTAISKHPLVAGAYTGPSPVAKPSNYGAAICERADLELVVAAAIAEYNSECWGRGVLQGRSPADVLASRLTPRRRLSQPLLDELRYSFKQVTVRSTDGCITFMGASYWCDELAALIGRPASERKISLRYDPMDLSAAWCRIGDVDCRLERMGKGGFDNAELAAEVARTRKRVNKALREAADALAIPEAELRRMARESAEAAEARTTASSLTVAAVGRKAG